MKVKIKPFMLAYLYDGKGNRVVVKIPANLKGVVPEEPKVILFERRVYLQTSTQPLSYINVLGARAKRL